MKKKLSIVLSIMMAFTFVLAACGSGSSGGSSKTSSDSNSSDNGKKNGNKYDLAKKGTFTYAASGEFKPFSYMKGNKMVGYDVAVGKAIAKKLGLKPDPQKAKFSGIVTGVKKHRYDAAVASHTITPERLKQVDFSEPYYYSGPQIFTRPDSDIKKADDLKGKEVSVSRGSTYVKMAKKYTDNIPQVDSDVVALESLAKGHHDAVITDAITGQIAINSGLKIKGQEVLGTSKQAVAVAKGNDKLKKAINKALDDLKKSGELKKLSEKWIHKDITKPLDK